MGPDKVATAIVADEDEYHSSEDEDFNPEQQPIQNDDDDASSSSESDGDEEAAKPARKSSKRKAKDVHSQDRELVDDNSGDEAIIRSAKAKRKKIKTEDEDDEGGEGGLIKTRAQRAREGREKIPRSTTTSATVDVDALWKSLNSSSSPQKALKPSAPPPGAKSTIQTITTSRIEPASSSTSLQNPDELGIQVSTAEAATAVPLPALLEGLPVEGVESRAETTAIIPTDKDGMITIKRSYEFAGETITEEKQVPANSFEARAYLSSLQTSTAPQTTGTSKPLRRPMRKVSKFDPGVGGGIKKAPKLNSLEKSRLDWAGFVDKEGIGDELDRKRRHGGDSYLERQDFLGRVDSRTSDKR